MSEELPQKVKKLFLQLLNLDSVPRKVTKKEEFNAILRCKQPSYTAIHYCYAFPIEACKKLS